MADFSGSGGSSGAVTQIAATTASATVASFAFTGISQAFSNLWLVLNAHCDNPAIAGVAQLQFNGDSSASYDYVNAISIGSAAVTVGAAAAATAARIAAISYTAAPNAATGLCSLLIPNYAGTTFYKTWAGSGGRKDADVLGNFINEAPWGSWRNTAAVTTVTVLVRGTSGTAQNFVSGSSAILYGLS